MKHLEISPDISLPIEFVTQTQAILARKRVGKSYTASVQAEEMLKRHQQVLVIDYTGAWYGLRAGRDGKPDGGYPIHVFGGDHADVRLEERAGEVLAAAAVKERFSAIFDMTSFRKSEALRFLAPFLETLYRLNREPLHLFADEADAYAPQRTFGGEDARTLGAMNDIVLRGGIRGIGCSIITQRSARINKDVLSQCGILTALRTSSPKDLAAVREWVEVHDEGGQSKEMMTSLPTLPIGTAWMWAPGWPTEAGIFQRVRIRKRETFDSGATPKPGQAVKVPKVLKPVDLAKLGETIRQTAEQAKANDPAALKRRVSELEKELATAAAVKPRGPEKLREIEKPVVTDAQLDRLEKLHARFGERVTTTWDRLLAMTEPLREGLKAEHALIGELLSAARAVRGAPAASRPVQAVATTVRAAPPPGPALAKAASGDVTLTAAQRRILAGAAWWASIGVRAPSRAQVAFVARIKPTGGHFSNSIGPLVTNGLLVNTGTGGVEMTAAGAAAAPSFDGSPSLATYHAGIREILASGAQQRIFDAIVGNGGESATIADIGAATGIDPGGGHFSNSIGPLSTLGLIDRRGGVVTPTSLMFPEGLQ